MTADRAKAAEDTQRTPLTALEWLRVTHADTLSGRRIEEALSAARADAAADRDRAWRTAVDADLIAGVLDSVVGDQLGQRAIDLAARQIAQTIVAARLRGLDPGSSEEGR